MTIEQRGQGSGNFLVTFFGHNHEFSNVQIMGRQLAEIERALQSREGGHFLFFEDSLSPANEESRREGVARFGGYLNYHIANHLHRSNRREPALREVEERGSQLDEIDLWVDLQRVINQGLIDPNKVNLCFLAKGLDDLGGRFDFKVVHETHPGSVSKDIDRLRSTYKKHEGEIAVALSQRNVPVALEQYRLACRYGALLRDTRDRDSVEQWKGRIRNTSLHEGGIFFDSMGAAHHKKIDLLRQKLGPKIQVDYEKIIAVDTDSPVVKVGFANAISTEQPLPDLLLAQSLFVLRIMQDFEDVMKQTNQLANFAYQYEDTFSVFSRIANSFSLEELRELLVLSPTSLIESTVTHPIAVDSGYFS